MVTFFYILIALFSIYVGKYEKRINVGLIAAPISVPLGIMTGIACVIVLKVMFFILALILILLSKVKIFITLKIGAILGSIAAAMLSSLAGPIGWLVAAILILFIIAGIKDAFVSIYEWFFRTMAQILLWIRKQFNAVRKAFPIFLHPIICIIEAAIVCGFALKGLWDLMDWLDGKIEVTHTLVKWRLLVLLPYALILYRNYIKDTNPPNKGGEGIDSPLLLEFTNIVDTIF
jgi:hypothetical protein